LSPELLERLGDLGFFFDDDVLPDGAIGEVYLRFQWPIGVDGVTGVDEEGGLDFAHGLVAGHAAPIKIDAPALAGRVAGPDEADVLLGCGRRPE